jgi:hypothetical protein
MTATRGQLLGPVLVATLGYGVWAALSPSPTPKSATTEVRREPVAREGSRAAPRSSSDWLDRLGRRPPASEPGVDLFGARTWSTAPQAAPGVREPAVAPPTQAPAVPAIPAVLPFTYMGRLASGDERVLFVAWGERNLVLREGDVVDAAYRLDRIDEIEATFTQLQSGARLQLSFLPNAIAALEPDRNPTAEAVGADTALASAATASPEAMRHVGGTRRMTTSRAVPVGAPMREANAELAAAEEAAAMARRARAIRAIPVEPWVCKAQQANELRDCGTSAAVEGPAACRQAAASRYRNCLGGALRSAQLTTPTEGRPGSDEE